MADDESPLPEDGVPVEEIPENERWIVEATDGIEKHYVILVWDDETEDWGIDTNLDEIPSIAAAISRVLFRMAIGDIQWEERDLGTAS